jgi:hypothetical protein
LPYNRVNIIIVGSFMPTIQPKLKVFLCHAPSDENAVRKLRARLIRDGVDAWLSSENLLAGQNRELEIRKAVRASDAVVVCLSGKFHQAGSQQREVRLALDTAQEQPDGEIFIIPARLEECELPDSLKNLQWVDLFSERGYERLHRSLKLDAERKNAAIPEIRSHSVERNIQTIAPSQEPAISPNLLQRVLAGIRQLRFDPKYMGIASLLIALFVCLFGNNIYAQWTGHSIFADAPTWTPTITVTATGTFPPTLTNTTVPSDTPTSVPPTVSQTPVPPAATVTPTPTHITPIPLGKDWLAGCVSTLWRPYPADMPVTERGDGCWQEPVHDVFVAENGDLDFLAQRRNAPVEVNGFFAPLPERGTVTFTIRLRELTNADLLMGIFAEPDVRSQGLLMIIPTGDVRKRVFVQKDPPNYETRADSQLFIQENGFSISFRFDENSAKSIVNPSAFFTNAVPIPSSQKWLFLGYKGLRGSYRVDGTFLNFMIE